MGSLKIGACQGALVKCFEHRVEHRACHCSEWVGCQGCVSSSAGGVLLAVLISHAAHHAVPVRSTVAEYNFVSSSMIVRCLCDEVLTILRAFWECVKHNG